MFFEGTSSLAVMKCHQFGTKLSHYGIELVQWPTDIKKKERTKTVPVTNTHTSRNCIISSVAATTFEARAKKWGQKRKPYFQSGTNTTKTLHHRETVE